jgi:hypothetical protein
MRNTLFFKIIIGNPKTSKYSYIRCRLLSMCVELTSLKKNLDDFQKIWMIFFKGQRAKIGEEWLYAAVGGEAFY